MTLPNRRIHASQTVETDHGPITICVGWDKPQEDGGQVVEIFFTERTKSGGKLEQLLYALGVATSKIIQGKPIDGG